MGVILAQQGGKAWVNPYVTDGLIAMWDGEWNAGGGVHDASSTSWTDISGKGHDAVGVYPTSDKTPPS